MSKMTRDDVNAAVRSHELFVDLVRSMRAAQSKLFYSSDANALRESKKLEREVDNWLEPFDWMIP